MGSYISATNTQGFDLSSGADGFTALQWYDMPDTLNTLNMLNMNPWLITDDVSEWGGTDFEDDQ